MCIIRKPLHLLQNSISSSNNSNDSTDNTSQSEVNGTHNAVHQVHQNLLVNDSNNDNNMIVVTPSPLAISNEHVTSTSDKSNNTMNNSTTSRKSNKENSDRELSENDNDGLLLRPKLNEDYAEIGIIEDEGDYSTPAVRNYELNRLEITLKNTIGVGQFGDVYIGIYQTSGQYSSGSSNSSTSTGNSAVCGVGNNSLNTKSNNHAQNIIIKVAVKTCKNNDNPEEMEHFLEEACMLL